jgi:MinD superfamily P-loop ATPase
MKDYLVLPNLDIEKCNGCGLCVGVCSCNSFVFVEKILKMIETSECDFCQLCEMVCPTGAIYFSFDIVEEEEEE